MLADRILSRPEAVSEHLVYNRNRRRAIDIVLCEVASCLKRSSHRPKETSTYSVVINFGPLVIGDGSFVFNIDVAVAQISSTEWRESGGTDIDDSWHGPDLFKKPLIEFSTLLVGVASEEGVCRSQQPVRGIKAQIDLLSFSKRPDKEARHDQQQERDCYLPNDQCIARQQAATAAKSNIPRLQCSGEIDLRRTECWKHAEQESCSQRGSQGK